MSSLIISPHLDDAILSLGGYLQQHKDKNDIVFTLFNTAWTTLEGDYSAQQITEMNLKEEKDVINLIGCKHKFANYDEALLRGYKNWNDSLRIEHDNYLLNSIISDVIGIVKENNVTKIFFPLAIGKHVDHVLVFEVAKKLTSFFSQEEIQILFYEDLPYATYGGKNERLNEIKDDFDLISCHINITDSFKTKCDFLKKYKTQLSDGDLERIKKYSYENSYNSEITENIWSIN